MNSLTIRSIENDVITITDERLLSLSFADDVTTNDSFDIGSVIVSQLDFEVVNFDGLYDDFEFYQANVVFTHDSQLICTTVIDKCVNNNGILDITAFDYLSKADVEFDELQVTLPTNAAALMSEVCRQCGLTLLTTSFSNGTYPITRFKDNVKYSCRAVMGYIAQIAGCWVKADVNGRIVLDWYDKTGQPVKAITNVSDTDVFGYDITITGLSVKAAGTTSDYGETVTAGTDVYMLKITDNPLIVENTAQDVLNGIKDKIIGLTFRPLSCAYISDWTLKPGQKVTVTARGNTYTCYVNSINNKVIGSGNISCEAARPSKMKMESQTAKTEAIARDITERHLSAYNLAMNNFTDLMSSALGLFHTEIIEQNGSTTHYWHNEEDLEDSQIQYKFSVAGFGVSHDYGSTWIAGIDAQGNILATVLTAIGVEASWVKVSDNVTLVAELNNLQDQIDNNIQTYSGTAIPTTSNYPANTWSEFDSHIGDLYYVSSGSKQGYCYRFMKDGNVYSWQLIKDTDLTTVLNALTVNGQIAQLVDYSTTTQMQGYVNTSIAGLSSVYSTKTEVNAELSSVERENLTPYPYTSVTGRVHLGITYTVNADGSITANGTATGTSIFYIRARGTEPYWYLKEGTYELSGCPSGGSLTTYCLALQGLNSAGTGTENLALDYGDTATFTIDSASASRPKQICIVVRSGQTFDNLTFYPMLEKGTIAHEYVPSVSTPTNTYNSLIENVSRIDQTSSQISTRVTATEQQVITASYRNLVRYPYYHSSGRSGNGVTFTVNSDGSITVNGTSTGQADFYMCARISPYWYLEEGTYILSGCPSGGGSTKYVLAVGGTNSAGTGVEWLANDYGDTATFTIDSASASRPKQICIVVRSGQTFDNLTFYPMLEKGTIAHKYEPTPTSQISLGNRMNSAESSITQNADQIALKVSKTEVVSAYYKNITAYPYFRANVFTNNGVTFTVNKDGSITANGTASANLNAAFHCSARTYQYGTFLERGKTYTLSGCPSGGTGKYTLNVTYNTATDGSTYKEVSDYGSGVTFTVDNAYVNDSITLAVSILKGQTVSNLTFYPMLEEGSIAHKYEPTTQSNITLANGDNTSTTYENLITYPYMRASGYTHRGVTFTVNSDGSVTAVGTPTANTPAFELTDRNVFRLPKGTYTLHPHSSNGNIGMSIYFYDKTDKTAQYTGGGSGIIQASTSTYVWTTQAGNGQGMVGGFNVPKTFTINDDAYCYVQVRTAYQADPTLSINAKVYPMLERGMTAHSYQPTPTSQSSVGNRMTTAESSITQNANNIALKVSQTDYNGATIASLINQSASTVTIQAEHIKLEGIVTANNNFSVGSDGSITAKNANFTGSVKSGSTITGATITGSSFTTTGFIIDKYSFESTDKVGGEASFRLYRANNRCNMDIYGNSWFWGNINIGGSHATLGSLRPTLTVNGTISAAYGINLYNGETDGTNGFYCMGAIYIETGYWINTPELRYHSDRRLKKDIQEITSDLALILLNNLMPQTFKMIDDECGKLRIGFVAQDVIKVLEENNLDKSLFVRECANPETKETFYSLAYDDFIGVLWKGWQEQQKTIEEQQAKINDLEERLKKIEDYLFKDEDEIIRENLRKRGIDV